MLYHLCLPQALEHKGGEGGSKPTIVNSNAVAQRHLPQLQRQNGKSSLLSGVPEQQPRVHFGIEGGASSPIVVTVLSDDDDISFTPHIVTLSSRKFPSALLDLIPEEERSDSFKAFIQKHNEIAGDDPSQAAYNLNITEEFTVRVILPNTLPKEIINTTESARAAYQPLLSRFESTRLGLSQLPTKVSFAIKDIDKLPIVNMLKKVKTERVDSSRNLTKDNDMHRLLKTHTAPSRSGVHIQYKPILAVDQLTRKPYIILDISSDDVITTLSYDTDRPKRMVLEKRKITKVDLQIQNNQPQLAVTKQKELRETTLDFIKDSFCLLGPRSVDTTYSSFAQNCIPAPEADSLTARKEIANLTNISLLRKKKNKS